MNDEKWQDIVGRIQDSFQVIEHKTVDLAEGPGTVEYIIFGGPLGKMKLERTTRPLVINKRGLGSRRIGSQTRVVYEYSDTEKTHTCKAYRWSADDNDWVEIEAGQSFKL